jgi:hypothetical protein
MLFIVFLWMGCNILERGDISNEKIFKKELLVDYFYNSDNNTTNNA